MKRVLTAVTAIIFFALPLFSQNTWIKQSSGYSESFKRVVFTDSLYGWIAGDSGLIVNTSNGGNNWITQSRKANDYLIDIHFLNRLYGWCIAWQTQGSSIKSIIYSTSNGGNNWITFTYSDTNTLLNTIYFLNQQTGFIGCTYTSTKTILRTTNGGTNWYPANIDTNFASSFPVKKIKFLNPNTGFAAGGYFDVCGVVWKTTDRGINWSSKTVGGEPFNSIDFPDTNTVVITGGDYEYGVSVSYSKDWGATWNWFFTSYFGIGYSLSYRTNTEGWITAGFSQLFLKTTDAGLSWSNVTTPDGSYVYSLTFPNQKTGWAVGDNGTILKFSGNSVGIIISENSVPYRTMLNGNYPNPFNQLSTINYQLSRPGGSSTSFVSIKVFDISGKEIATLVNQWQVPGIYRVTFDGSGLASGVYYYQLVTDCRVVHTRRLVLVK